MNPLVLLFALLIATVPPFRQAVIDLVGNVGRLVGGAAIGATVVWAVTTLIFGIIGAFTGSWFAGVMVGMLFPLPIALVIFNQKTRRFVVGLLMAVFVICLGKFMFGVSYPATNKAWNSLFDSKVEEQGNRFRKGTLKSEPMTGVFGIVTKEGVLHTSSGMVHVNAGTRVRMLGGLRGQPATDNSEGMTQVMLEDGNGEHTDGTVGMFSIRKLDFPGNSFLASFSGTSRKEAECVEYNPATGKCRKFFNGN